MGVVCVTCQSSDCQISCVPKMDWHGPEKTQKIKFSEMGLPGVEKLNGPGCILLPLSRASQLPYSEKSENCRRPNLLNTPPIYSLLIPLRDVYGAHIYIYIHIWGYCQLYYGDIMPIFGRYGNPAPNSRKENLIANALKWKSTFHRKIDDWLANTIKFHFFRVEGHKERTHLRVFSTWGIGLRGHRISTFSTKSIAIEHALRKA